MCWTGLGTDRKLAKEDIKKKFILMNKNETMEKIFNELSENGKVTSKADILGTEPLEDKVFTKRIDINKTMSDGTEIVCITVTSNDFTFRDATSADMRVNTKNYKDQWCNLFADETPEEILEIVETSRFLSWSC